MIFKCKNCGGNVIYSPEKRGMYCPFCDSEKSEERKEYPKDDLKVCPNCGGEVPVLEHTSATKCPYCDNYLILDERVEGEYQPDLLIPFQFGIENCKKALRDRFHKCTFAPTDFLSEAKMNGMEGTYVPFWFFHYNAHCDFQGEGTKVRSWTTGTTQYTETSYYNVVRDMNIDFQKIPVDASVQMPDDIMDLMEPFGYEQLQTFSPEYLSGFYAEKYNMKSDLIESRAQDKMNQDAEQMLKESYAGYGNVRTLHKGIQTSDRKVQYGLLPVWRYQYQYNDKTYPFYVNGQTGKIVGMPPVSMKKVWAYAGTLWACLVAILALINGICML